MNSTSKKIGLIGRIDPDQTMFDGQTVKTRMTYRMLCEHYGAENVVTVDTLDYRHRAWLSWQTSRAAWFRVVTSWCRSLSMGAGSFSRFFPSLLGSWANVSITI